MAKLEINSENILPDLKPKENITLWRYMSFSSLCEILMNDYIPLIPIQHFSDKSEGRVLKEILSKLSDTNELAIEQTMQMYKETTLKCIRLFRPQFRKVKTSFLDQIQQVSNTLKPSEGVSEPPFK